MAENNLERQLLLKIIEAETSFKMADAKYFGVRFKPSQKTYSSAYKWDPSKKEWKRAIMDIPEEKRDWSNEEMEREPYSSMKKKEYLKKSNNPEKKRIESIPIYNKSAELFWELKTLAENDKIKYDGYIQHSAEYIDTIYDRIKRLKIVVDGHIHNMRGDKIKQIDNKYSSWAEYHLRGFHFAGKRKKKSSKKKKKSKKKKGSKKNIRSKKGSKKNIRSKKGSKKNIRSKKVLKKRLLKEI